MVGMSSHERLPIGFGIARSNFVPLKTIVYYLGENESVRVTVSNLLGNIIS